MVFSGSILKASTMFHDISEFLETFLKMLLLSSGVPLQLFGLHLEINRLKSHLH